MSVSISRSLILVVNVKNVNGEAPPHTTPYLSFRVNQVLVPKGGHLMSWLSLPQVAPGCLVCLCCEGRLRETWTCPMGCGYRTDVARSRASHLLRDHHLHFMGRYRTAVPLEGEELRQTLDGFR